LGMPIVRAIVDAMGGDIQVDSIENEGTTFTVAVDKRIATPEEIEEYEEEQAQDAAPEEIPAEVRKAVTESAEEGKEEQKNRELAAPSDAGKEIQQVIAPAGPEKESLKGVRVLL
ncbi:MAG: hypothetical protein LUB61_06775, partial [Eggerthellaceae bacterium]|nr:hypothetical protein [Eggerthellaceae bacterium]